MRSRNLLAWGFDFLPNFGAPLDFIQLERACLTPISTSAYAELLLMHRNAPGTFQYPS
jgi:hypothetical protein